MPSYSVDIVLREGHTVDDLTSLVLSNPKYVFECNATLGQVKRLRKKPRATYRWKHKRFGGPVKLKKKGGVSSAEVPEAGVRPGQPLGAFVSWLFTNAGDIVHRLDIRRT